MPKTKSLILSLLLVGALASATPVLANDGGYGGGGSSNSGYSLDDARSLIERGRYRDAIGVLRHVVDAEPRNADALNLLGFSLRKNGDMRNAQGFYLKALKIRPNHRDANEYLGELYVEIGQFEKARARLDALEGICGTSCREYRALKSVIDKAS
jgi:tetratricopeptide (TPR) repeat protein